MNVQEVESKYKPLIAAAHRDVRRRCCSVQALDALYKLEAEYAQELEKAKK